jgi:rSAM/selenodomain-associated transferase 2
MARVSVIIPTLNEAGFLPSALASLKGNRLSHEVIVVDAASQDATVELARTHGAEVLHSPRKQRAAQMNLGARAASGGCFVFLHADTRLPEGGLDLVATALGVRGVVGGAFARQFEPASAWLRLSCRISTVRSRTLRWYFGDQAIFTSRSAYEQLGGFSEWDLFEDLDLARRLKRLGRTVLLDPPAISSGRRFTGQSLRVSLRDVWLTVRFLCGAPPDQLAPQSRRNR